MSRPARGSSTALFMSLFIFFGVGTLLNWQACWQAAVIDAVLAVGCIVLMCYAGERG